MDYSNIPGFLTTIFGFYVTLYSYNYFTESNLIINNKNIFIILIYSLIMISNNFYNVSFLKIPSSIIIIILFFLTLEKKINSKIVLSSIFISLLSIIIEFAISIMLALVVKDLKIMNRLLPVKDLFSLIFFWTYYFITKNFVFKYVYNKTLELLNKKKVIYILIMFFFFLTGALYSMYVVNYLNIQVYIFGLIIILIYVVIICCYLKEVHNNDLLKLKNVCLIERQQLYNSALEDYRILRHNLLNDFVFISSVCDEKVQKVIKEKVKKYDGKTKYITDISNIPEGLQGLIYFKSNIARKKNILFYTDNELCHKQQNFEIFSKKIYIDLFEIICITLDNAIEAADLSDNKVIYFNITSKNNKVYFVILNTFNNQIDLNNISNKNYSTKGPNRGLGLNYTKFLNKEIKIKTSIINNLFKTEISIMKKTKE